MICQNCPTREKCTKSKSCQKTVTKHIWSDYIELAEDARYTPEYKELYRERKDRASICRCKGKACNEIQSIQRLGGSDKMGQA